MRLLALIVLSASLLFFARAAAAQEELSLIGAGVITSASPYLGVGTKSMVIPVVIWNYKDFYLKGVEAGYHFFKTDKLRLSVLAMPRFMGYHSSDSDALQAMEDRKMSLEAGGKVEFELPWEGSSVSVKATNDMLSRHKGCETELSLAHKFKGGIWRLTPSLGVRVQSGRMTDYYYGVKSDEVRADRPEYMPGTAVNYFAGAVFSFGIHKDWIVLTQGSVESLASEIRKSPIVKKDALWTGVVGIARRF